MVHEDRKLLLSTVEIATIEMDILRKDVKNCNPSAPETSSKVTKILTEARYDKEVTEKEYKEKMEILKKETDRFKKNCSCIIKTVAGKYD